MEGICDNSPQNIIKISGKGNVIIKLHLNTKFIDSIPRSKWNIINIKMFAMITSPSFSIYLDNLNYQIG